MYKLCTYIVIPFFGFILEGIDNLKFLTLLGLNQNKLSGLVPPSLGNLRDLIELFLYDNEFSCVFFNNLKTGLG